MGNGAGGGVVGVGTLLGPEGADPPPVDGRIVHRRGGRLSRVGAVRVLVPPAVCGAHQRAGGGGVWRGGCPGGGRLVVENCTVDASIFFDCRPAQRCFVRGVVVGGVCCSCVAKLLRAHGGCLGTRSR